MPKLILLSAALLLALTLAAAAQTKPKNTAPGAAAPGQPKFSTLTADECRKLGGKTSVDDTGACKLRMRCTVTHANGDVYSSCINEAK
jgi:hypothetical protein